MGYLNRTKMNSDRGEIVGRHEVGDAPVEPLGAIARASRTSSCRSRYTSRQGDPNRFGRRGGTRTPGQRYVTPLRYQLRHSPKMLEPSAGLEPAYPGWKPGT